MPESNTRKNVFVTDLSEGRQVNDLFLVSRKTLAETKAGKPYLALTLMDRSGEIEARLWDNADRFDDQAAVGNIIAVQGTAKSFRDQLQLTINSLRRVDAGSVSPTDFMPASKYDVSEMRAELLKLIDGITDAELQALLLAVFQGPLLEQFVTAPAAKRMHHAYLGGLIEHTLSVTGLAAKISDHYPELDRDLLLTGALLHDIGKTREFSYKTVPFEYTSPGRLIGHLVIGSEMVRQEAAAVPNLAPERLDQLVHLILSHHGRHEFGSPCLPMTMEAILLHHLDNMDAKMNYIGRLSEQVEEDEYQWSDYQPLMERFLLLRGQDGEKTGTTAAKYAASPPQQARGNTHKKDKPAEQEQPSPQRTLF